MKKRIVNVLNGIADGIFPSIGNSIKNTNDGREINRARLTASVLSWMLTIAFLMGVIPLSSIVEILKMIFLL